MKAFYATLAALLAAAATASAQNNVGINTTTPDASAALDITSTTGGVLVPRMDSSQRAGIGNPATGLLVYQTNGAMPGFYYYNGTAWMPISTGTESQLEKITQGGNTGYRLLGADTVNYGAIGTGAVDLSYNNARSTTRGATGTRAFAAGWNTQASGTASTALGFATIASGSASTALGNGTNASGNYSTATGNFTTAPSFGELATGVYNTAYTPVGATYIDSTDRVLSVGIGTGPSDRKDGLIVYKDGTIALNSRAAAPATTAGRLYNQNDSLWFSGTNLTGGISQLQKITQGGKTGYRLLGRNAANYGNIGSNAVDFSYSNNPSTTKGATGMYAFAAGYYTRAAGISSTALGDVTEATGDFSVALGNHSTAQGLISTAMGIYTNASGNYSTAMGNYSTAGGNSSTATGYTTLASGDFSTAMGYVSKASALASTALGSSTASGAYSTAMGNGTTASAYSSTAMGGSSIASGDYSTAMGNNTKASVYASTAMGNSSTASGTYSTALGNSSMASGESSTAMGFSTIASGTHSTAMGNNTFARSWGEVAVGNYNTDYTAANTDSFNNADRAFVVGIGDNGMRKDGLTVYKSGNTLISNNKANNVSMTGTTSVVAGLAAAALQVSAGGDGMTVVSPVSNNTLNVYKSSFLGSSSKFVSFGAINYGSAMEQGSITSTSSGNGINYNTTSDQRLKTDNGTYRLGLKTINAINIHNYTWKRNGAKEVGVFAQELYKVYPGAVSKGDDNDSVVSKRWLVDYSKLVPVLTAAVQELSKENDQLKAENERLRASQVRTEASIEKLNARLDALEGAPVVVPTAMNK